MRSSVLKKTIGLLGIVVAMFGMAAGILAQGNRPPILPELYYHRLQVATSANGLAWRAENNIIREQTTAPDVIVRDGQLWVYAVDTSFLDGQGSGQTLIALQEQPDGTLAEAALDLPFDGLPAAPSAVLLDDGQVRLYFTDVNDQLDADAATAGRVYSAVSEDGVTFTVEDGVRFESATLTDADVVRTADGWLLFATLADGTLVSAQSSDGLTFTQSGEGIEGANADTVALADGSFQQFGCAADGTIAIKASPDGAQWIDFGTTGIAGCDPSIARLADGVWLMVYRDIAPQGISAPPPSFSATVSPPSAPPSGGEPPLGAPPRP